MQLIFVYTHIFRNSIMSSPFGFADFHVTNMPRLIIVLALLLFLLVQMYTVFIFIFIVIILYIKFDLLAEDGSKMKPKRSEFQMM